ncbi:hypothetical protein [Haloferula sp. BvORR071]|uniref:hypothetical protein n=1 Tax=Haloferula sp. BvORR071 TaxID=1396141 RepID=UPI000550457E|nr:hypothetical protein [Haloferula sp. BvORR071]
MDPAFQKDFLRDFKRGNGGPVLALFGKHPAWNDHMDDFGLSTPSLRSCKRLLYLQGMAANAARQQSEGGPVQPYQHFLLWLRESEAMLIRMVESEDGRGRGYFPFMAAVHFDSTEAQRSLRVLLPALRGLVADCRNLHSRDAVRDRHRQAQDQISAELRHLPPGELADESCTRDEVFALRGLATRSGFPTEQVAISRYDHAQAFAALLTAWRGSAGERVLLIAHADPLPSLTLGAGEPQKGDFWFLRGA